MEIIAAITQANQNFMRYTISKEFTFEAAHRLIKGYQGKCASLHGHSYKVTVTLEADTLDQYSFLLDYAAMKPFKDYVDTYVDHAVMCSVNDIELIETCEKFGSKQKLFIIPYDNTSAENLAAYFYSIAQRLFAVKVAAVSVNETIKTSATYYND